MNKTIIININGTVFHIEEDAYEILKNYMTEVKRYFMNSADSLEITTDIENRIAEMFTDILARDSKQALVEQDVRFVIEQMGSIQDFATADEDAPVDAQNPYEFKGTGSRKLFRDPDDHLLGGVCAGIANYFDFGVTWVRLAFALGFVFFGTGLLLYIILWLVVPKAVTRADRMAMKGQKLTLEGFKRNFEEELGSVKNNLHSLERESRPFIYKTRDFASDVFGHSGNFFKTSGKFLLKLAGIAIVLSAFALIIGLIVFSIAFLAYDNDSIFNWFPFNIVNYEINLIFLVCGVLLVSIPLLAIILLVISALYKRNAFTRTTGFTLLSVWLVSLCVVIYQSAKATADFRRGANVRKTIPIAAPSKGTYYLKLNDTKYLTREDSTRLNVNERFKGMIIVNDQEYDFSSPGNRVQIYIERADVPTPVLVESFSARGRSYEEALLNARAINYQFVQQDSVLQFAPVIERPQGSLWRDQRLRLTLKLPLNSKLVIDESLSPYLPDVYIYDCKTLNKQDNATSAPYIITNTGAECKVDTLLATPAYHQEVDTAIAVPPVAVDTAIKK